MKLLLRKKDGGNVMIPTTSILKIEDTEDGTLIRSEYFYGVVSEPAAWFPQFFDVIVHDPAPANPLEPVSNQEFEDKYPTLAKLFKGGFIS